jgi:hypothetical protein
VLKKNNSTELFKVLKKVTSNKSFRRKKQTLFYKKNNFDIKLISKKLDTIRNEIINKNKLKLIMVQKEFCILLISTKIQMAGYIILLQIS